MTRVVIVHNAPVSYKHLLFEKLAERLDLEVVYHVAASLGTVPNVDVESARYKYRIGRAGQHAKSGGIGATPYIWKSLARIGPEVVITGGWETAASWTAWLWSQTHGRPLILWTESNHFDYKRVWWKESVKRLFLAGTFEVHVYGVNNVDYLRRLGYPDDRLLGDCAVVDFTTFASSADRRARGNLRNLYFVGRFENMKNLPFLLKGFDEYVRRFSDSSMTLHLVGSGSLDGNLRQMTRGLASRDRITFHGLINHDMLPTVLADADALILPSTRETWGIVVFEAMASGLPVIVSQRCGTAGEITSETGWTFSPTDGEDLLHVLRLFEQAPRDRLCSMGAAGIRLASEHAPNRVAQRIATRVSAVANTVQLTEVRQK